MTAAAACIVISFFINKPVVWPAYCTAPMACDAAEKLRQQMVPDYPMWKRKHPGLTGPVVMTAEHPNYQNAIAGRTEDFSAWKNDHPGAPLPTLDNQHTTVDIPPCQPFPAD